MEKKKLAKAISLMDKNDFKKALVEFEKILKSTEDIYTKNKLNSFINICNNKLNENNDKDVDLYTKAVFDLNNNNLEKAIETLSNLLKKEKDNDTYLYTLSVAYMKMGDEEKALDFLKQSIEINKNNLYIALNEENLTELAKSLTEE